MIYVAGLQFDRGVGKSALLSHVWRQLRQDSKLFAVFIRCIESAPTNRPAGICTAIVQQLHKEGYLWQAFWRLMLIFAIERKSLVFTGESVETLSRAFPKPVDNLPLLLYTHVSDSARFAAEVAKWLQEKYRVGERLSLALSESYLSRPLSFVERLGRAADPITSFGDVMSLMLGGGFEYGYLFLDQFEDSVMSCPTGKMGEFGLGLRRMLEASSGKASIIVTLHPDSEQKLNSNPAVQNLQSLAPIDAKRYISLNVLEENNELIVPLTAEYLKNFRAGDVPYETFPIDPKVIRYACFLKKGNLRYILQQLHDCVNFGALSGAREIDMEFVLENHDMTMGSELVEEKHDEFTRTLERP